MLAVSPTSPGGVQLPPLGAGRTAGLQHGASFDVLDGDSPRALPPPRYRRLLAELQAECERLHAQAEGSGRLAPNRCSGRLDTLEPDGSPRRRTWVPGNAVPKELVQCRLAAAAPPPPSFGIGCDDAVFPPPGTRPVASEDVVRDFDSAASLIPGSLLDVTPARSGSLLDTPTSPNTLPVVSTLTTLSKVSTMGKVNSMVAEAGEYVPNLDGSSSHLGVSAKVKRVSQELLGTQRELKTEFRQLCQAHNETHEDGCNSICAEVLYEMRECQESLMMEVLNKQLTIVGYKSALRAFNKAFCSGHQEDSIDCEREEELQAMTYVTLFQDNNWTESIVLESRHKETLQQICQALINQIMTQDIAGMLDINVKSLFEKKSISTPEVCGHILDGLTGLCIVLNVMTLTLSLDIDSEWPGWEAIEMCFTVFFMVEICLRIRLKGFNTHFRGHDRAWNYFDLLVVILGVADTILSFVGLRSGSAVTAIRILRLFRIIKMVRVLRLKMLKELRLIVSGLFGGLRTIFWAFIFLFFFVLALGISTKQLLSVEPADPKCSSQPWGCSQAELHVEAYRRELFGTVPRCMFTIFRCFVADGCASVDGVPLMMLLWDQYGSVIILGYVCCFLFLTFGLFNLIMATIVESTMDAGKQDDMKRRSQRQKEHLQVAHTVQDLVRVLCGYKEEETDKASGDKLHLVGPSTSSSSAMLNARISVKRFHDLWDDPKVVDLLDQLGVTTMDPSSFIEAFDANEDGMLSTAELVKGLLKIRGRVEKSDIVANLIACREILRSLKGIEEHLLHERNAVHCSVQPQLSAVQQVPTSKSMPAQQVLPLFHRSSTTTSSSVQPQLSAVQQAQHQMSWQSHRSSRKESKAATYTMFTCNSGFTNPE